MKPGSNNSRGRSRGRNNNNNNNNNYRRSNVPSRNTVLDSTGPCGRIRGNAYQLMEKYLASAKDAMSQNDRVLAESCFQYADHYFRIHSAAVQAEMQYNSQQQQYQSSNDYNANNGNNGNNWNNGNEYNNNENCEDNPQPETFSQSAETNSTTNNDFVEPIENNQPQQTQPSIQPQPQHQPQPSIVRTIPIVPVEDFNLENVANMDLSIPVASLGGDIEATNQPSNEEAPRIRRVNPRRVGGYTRRPRRDFSGNGESAAASSSDNDAPAKIDVSLP